MQLVLIKPIVPIKPLENKPESVLVTCNPGTQDTEAGEASELEASPIYTE